MIFKADLVNKATRDVLKTVDLAAKTQEEAAEEIHFMNIGAKSVNPELEFLFSWKE